MNILSRWTWEHTHSLSLKFFYLFIFFTWLLRRCTVRSFPSFLALLQCSALPSSTAGPATLGSPQGLCTLPYLVFIWVSVACHSVRSTLSPSKTGACHSRHCGTPLLLSPYYGGCVAVTRWPVYHTSNPPPRTQSSLRARILSSLSLSLQ